jgi:hypothetical protein
MSPRGRLPRRANLGSGARGRGQAEEAPLFFADLLRAAEEDALAGQERLDVVEETAVLSEHQLVDAFGHRDQGRGGREPVGTRGLISGMDPALQHGRAHHEELVEIRAEDGEELDALEQGHRGILGLLEHPPVELEPGQLTVHERVGGQLRGGHRAPRRAGSRRERRGCRPRESDSLRKP